jgi:hypothetical protein
MLVVWDQAIYPATVPAGTPGAKLSAGSDSGGEFREAAYYVAAASLSNLWT